MKYRYFIFDMDGTLMDTGDGIVASLQRLQKKAGLKDLPEETLRLFLGPPLKESMMKYYGVTYEETEELTDIYRGCYFEVGLEKTRIFKGIKEMFGDIHEAGAKSAVATLKQHQLASAIMKREGLAELVDYISLNIDNSLGDKAELINECVREIGCTDKNQALMFGDSPNDAEAAMRAGLDFVALGFGEGFKPEGALKRYPYAFVIKDEENIRKDVQNILKLE